MIDLTDAILLDVALIFFSFMAIEAFPHAGWESIGFLICALASFCLAVYHCHLLKSTYEHEQ